MKDLSFFMLKNSLTSRMKKGFKNACNSDDSTSTLNQRKPKTTLESYAATSPYMTPAKSPPTLEEMILQLELEEIMARKAKLDDEYGDMRRRMSCVNNSDILRSARKALDQYPRFSLDGKDAMYLSSFRTGGLKRESKLGGERVVWCKPGVVAKLMGLDAIPVPAHSRYGDNRRKVVFC